MEDIDSNIENESKAESEQTKAQAALKQKLNRIINASWDDFFQTISSLPAGYEIGACLKLLNVADELINQGKDLGESSTLERYLIGGVKDNKVHNTYPFGTQLMGDMQSFASFKKLLNKDPAGLAKLLKVIPINGPIDGWHFMQFVDTFKQLFEANGFKQAYVFPATRLLSMKRPDQFVALDPNTAETFCQALEIKPLKNQDFQRYWDQIIVPLQQAPWFKMHQPMDAAQIPIHRSRFALLERLVCTPIAIEQAIEQSIEQANQETVEDSGKQTNDNQPLSNSITENNLKQDTQVSSQASISEPVEKPVVESNLKVDFNHITNQPIRVKQATAQPKKMTIAKKKSAKVNKAAATKLMSQYYFANKQKFAKVDMSKNRDLIIDKLVEGESVEDVFDEFLAAVK